MVLPAVEHRSHKGLNNRAENSHLPLRKRERATQKFKSPGQLQKSWKSPADASGCVLRDPSTEGT